MPETYAEQVFLESLIKSLVSKPDEVKLARKVDELGTLYTVSVAKEDVSRIIGKGGETAKSIRGLLRIVAYNNKVHATMKIDAPYIGKRQESAVEEAS